MLERILPPTFARRQLPEPRSKGAQLTVRYCIQCHNLPNPAMHDAKRWPSVVDRMVARMRGKGNLGALMTEMMASVEAPSVAEQHVLLAYFTRNAQKPLDEAEDPGGASAVRANHSGSHAASATSCQIRRATLRRNGPRSSSACAGTWNG
jgi:hypothetical protein